MELFIGIGLAVAGIAFAVPIKFTDVMGDDWPDSTKTAFYINNLAELEARRNEGQLQRLQSIQQQTAGQV